MKWVLTFLFGLGFMFLIGSCASLKPKKFDLKHYEEIKMENGLSVIYIPDESLPRVSYSILVNAGQNTDDGLAGLNAFVANLLSKGTQSHNALEVADLFAQMGTSLKVYPSNDFTFISTSGLSVNKKELFELFWNVLTQPTFSANETNRLRKQIIAQLKKEADQASDFADIAFNDFIYEKHPYGNNLNGTLESVKQIERKHLIRHYFKFYVPANSYLSITGPVDDHFKQELEKKVSQWKTRSLSPIEEVKVSELTESPIRLVYKSGMQQAQIRFGHLSVSRSHPDYFIMKVANEILGSYDPLSSRLGKKVRVNEGLTYDIRSQFDNKKTVGDFSISTFTRNEKVSEVIKIVRQELDDFVKNGVNEKELEIAKTNLKSRFPQLVETSDQLAMNLLVLRAYGIGDQYLTDYFNRLDSITVAQVNQVIRRQFHPSKIKTLVFATQDKVYNQLISLGKVEAVPYSRIIAK